MQSRILMPCLCAAMFAGVVLGDAVAAVPEVGADGLPVDTAAPPVKELNVRGFRKFRKRNPKNLVMLHAAQWDKVSQKMLPDFAALNDQVFAAGETGIRFGTVDCVEYHKVCYKLGVSGFPPPVLLFMNGTKDNVTRIPDVGLKPGLVAVKKFLLGSKDPATTMAEERVDGVAVPEWDKSGVPVELSRLTFGEFHTTHKKMVVMFYNPASTCSSSKDFMPHFKAAAAAFKDEVPFAKVNCHDEDVLCHVFNVDHTPKTRFYHRIQTMGTPFSASNGDVAAQLKDFVTSGLESGYAYQPGDKREEEEHWGEEEHNEEMEKRGFHRPEQEKTDAKEEKKGAKEEL